MAKNWTVNADEPDLVDKYEWRSPNNDQQHVAETTIPGDLRIKPKDISLIPTLAPKKSGIQHGWNDWSFEVDPPTAWYVYGEIVQEDD